MHTELVHAILVLGRGQDALGRHRAQLLIYFEPISGFEQPANGPVGRGGSAVVSARMRPGSADSSARNGPKGGEQEEALHVGRCDRVVTVELVCLLDQRCQLCGE